MLKKLLLLCFCVQTFYSIAQLPQNNWAYIPEKRIKTAYAVHSIADMTIDKQGNILAFGSCSGNPSDMDPSELSGDTSFTETGDNYYFSKTSPNGKLIFVKYLRKTATSSFVTATPKRIMVDNNNDIIIITEFMGKMDFNPSKTDSANLASKEPTYPDMCIAKYTSNGIYLWANAFGGVIFSSKSMYASACLSANNDIIVNTQFTGTADIDPSEKIQEVKASGNVLISYNSSGQYNWHSISATKSTYGIQGFTIEADASNNTISASMGGYATTLLKTNSQGQIVWNRLIGTGAWPYTNRTELKGLNVAANGDFIIYGSFLNLMDFDLGAGVDTVRSSTKMNNDYFIAKYTGEGNLIWKKTFSNATTFGKGFIDSDNNFYCVGSIKDDLILDGVTIVGGINTSGAFYAKFNANGVLQKTSGLGFTSSFDAIFTYNLSNSSFAVTGKINQTGDIDPTPATKILETTLVNSFTAVYGIYTISINASEPNFINLYPNPANNQLYLSGNLNSDFSIYDLQGKLILNGPLFKSSIDISSVPNGIYVLQIGNSFERFIKQ